MVEMMDELMVGLWVVLKGVKSVADLVALMADYLAVMLDAQLVVVKVSMRVA